MRQRNIKAGLILLLALLTAGMLLLAGCGSGPEAGSGSSESAGGVSNAEVERGAEDFADQETIDEDGAYYTKDDVALYIHIYGKLPDNFITKKEAKALGWSGGSLERYADGAAIGGDRFGNYEGNLPDGSYRECDIDTKGRKERGAKRIIYDDEGNIYYTEDHYRSFEQLYDKDGEV